MSTYQEKQRVVIDALEQQFKEGTAPTTTVTPVENYTKDNRMTLGFFYFPPKEILKTIHEKIITPLQDEFPEQYYLPAENLHITIKNIRGINVTPQYSNDTIEKAKTVLKKVGPLLPRFTYDIKGIFHLPSSISLRCYADERLYEAVSKLDKALQNAGIPDDKQYASNDIFFGNITICRFQKKPSEDFLRRTESFKDMSFGEAIVDTIRLLTCNTVCEPTTRVEYANFSLL